MKLRNLMIAFVFSGVLMMVGCNEDMASEPEKVDVKKDSDRDHQKEDDEPQFKPGKFEPGNFEPGKFETGTFEPGNFEPGTFKPGTFTPGNFDTSVTISIEDDEIMIEVPSDLLFDFDKSELKSESIITLEQLVEDLNQYEGAILSIYGHTDNQGELDYNQSLSEKRANKVKRYVENKVNPEKVNIETKGFGQTKPIVTNDTKEGQAINRRVEIIVEPLVKQ
ncbi:OmpA family protein [Ferdinandcohnia quinoae]|uniref:OmpA family protein n=1 Tax=Fredinandcohnia quinoae TaxID=2918902 RepID=A0AAW5E5R0_9BACI|nr:OmpA family protein [Fredinandcohnia sp. SECRCQ15]MCH1627688.1 OmpA family protein [Fredinandcohnia sp. SECRCQ15]